MNVQDECIKIHSQFGMSEMANYKIQLLFDSEIEKVKKEYEEKLRWIPFLEKMPAVDSIIECKKEDKVFFSGKVIIKEVENTNRYYVEGMFHGTGNIDLLYNFTEWRFFYNAT